MASGVGGDGVAARGEEGAQRDARVIQIPAQTGWNQQAPGWVGLGKRNSAKDQRTVALAADTRAPGAEKRATGEPYAAR